MSVSTDPPKHGAKPFLRALSPFMPVISTAATLGLLLGLVLVGVFHPKTSAAPVAAGTSASGGGAPSVVNVNVTEGDLFVKPSSIEVPSGATVIAHVHNTGSMEHTLALEGHPVPLIKPGATATMHWGPITHSTQAWCIVPGHKDAGMILNINVKGDSSAASSSGGAATGSTVADDGAKIDPNAKPGAGWHAFDPTLKPADGSKVHSVHFVVQAKQIEVAPGVKQTLWTYNGHAPGPILRGKVGDVFKVTLTNHANMEHSIDFHASKVAPNVQMRLLKPGQSLVYEFKANYAGIFTYHCDASPMIQHFGNGMFGAVIVDPPHLDHVNKEIVLVQSELYLGKQGQIQSLPKMMADQNDAVIFNGYYNQYVYSPIHVKAGDRVRVWLDDAAINEDLAFHTVGTIFDTVWKEGHYTLQPNSPDHGGSQTLDLQPTQGGFVEFTLDKPGTYVMVNHRMRDLMRGAEALIVAS